MELRINQKTYQVEADADTPLLWVIRDDLGLTGTKYGCGLAQCGACSVLVDGNVVRACVTPVAGVVGREVTTIEAIEADAVGKRVVAAWVEHQVAQWLTAVSFVSTGMGIAVVPECLSRTGTNGVAFRPIVTEIASHVQCVYALGTNGPQIASMLELVPKHIRPHA